MYKVRIKRLIRGKIRHKDDGYSVGFKTKYGTVWMGIRNFWRFKMQNKHLIKRFGENWKVDEEKLIGKYIYITEKYEKRSYRGDIIIHPIL